MPVVSSVGLRSSDEVFERRETIEKKRLEHWRTADKVPIQVPLTTLSSLRLFFRSSVGMNNDQPLTGQSG